MWQGRLLERLTSIRGPGRKASTMVKKTKSGKPAAKGARKGVRKAKRTAKSAPKVKKTKKVAGAAAKAKRAAAKAKAPAKRKPPAKHKPAKKSAKSKVRAKKVSVKKSAAKKAVAKKAPAKKTARKAKSPVKRRPVARPKPAKKTKTAKKTGALKPAAKRKAPVTSKARRPAKPSPKSPRPKSPRPKPQKSKTRKPAAPKAQARTPAPVEAQPERDWSETLFLPKTDFPMKAGLPQREPELLKRWAEMRLYDRQREAAMGRARYVLHDGPPYANGHLHIGHALNKILKDVISRSQSMMGKDANYVPGWDCHGLPIEWKVEEENYRAKGRAKPDLTDTAALIAFRRECRDEAAKWLDVQREEFKRLGI